MEDSNALELHIRNAQLADLDKQAKELRAMYEVYRTVRRITSTPGEMSLDFAIRAGEETFSEKELTLDQLRASAARFRILRGIKEHVLTNVEDVQSFDLAFDLACRRIPEEIEVGDIFEGGGPINR